MFTGAPGGHVGNCSAEKPGGGGWGWTRSGAQEVVQILDTFMKVEPRGFADRMKELEGGGE